MAEPLLALEELAGLMPLAAALRITVDHATPEAVRGAVARAPGEHGFLTASGDSIA